MMREHIPPSSSSCKRPRPSSAFSSDSRASSSSHSHQQQQAPDGNDQSEVNPGLRCCYRSKQCPNQRAMKLNGERHKLCEYHRRRANLNQQRVHQRRKLRMKQSEWVASSSTTASSPRTGTDGLGCAATGTINLPSLGLHNNKSVGMWTVLEPFTSPCGDLPVHDLIILEALLLGSTPATSPRQQSVVQDADAVSKVYVYANGVRREL